MTDLERFVHDTLAFVTKCVPDATLDKRTSAAADIVKHFKWLFDKAKEISALEEKSEVEKEKEGNELSEPLTS